MIQFHYNPWEKQNVLSKGNNSYLIHEATSSSSKRNKFQLKHTKKQKKLEIKPVQSKCYSETKSSPEKRGEKKRKQYFLQAKNEGVAQTKQVLEKRFTAQKYFHKNCKGLNVLLKKIDGLQTGLDQFIMTILQFC